MRYFYFILFLLSANTFAGNTHGPHTHGKMEFVVNQLDDTLRLTLVAPAQDLIGYERAPKSAKEKKALRNFDEKYDPFVMFKFNKAADCQFSQGRSVSDMFSASPHKHGFLDKTHSHDAGLKGHIGFLMEYDYTCKATTETAIEIRLEIFELAPSIKTIDVHIGSIDSAVKTTLTRENNLLIIDTNYPF